jgi:hypothetical protein
MASKRPATWKQKVEWPEDLLLPTNASSACCRRRFPIVGDANSRA